MTTPRYIQMSGALVEAFDGLGNPVGDWVTYSDYQSDLTAAQEDRDSARDRVKSLVLDLSAAVGRYQRAERERDNAVAWNHRVSVCANHTAEIVDGPCVICELEAAERKAKESATMVSVIVKWLEREQPGVFKRGLWDVIGEANDAAIAAKGEA